MSFTQTIEYQTSHIDELNVREEEMYRVGAGW